MPMPPPPDLREARDRDRRAFVPQRPGGLRPNYSKVVMDVGLQLRLNTTGKVGRGAWRDFVAGDGREMFRMSLRPHTHDRQQVPTR